MSAANDYLSGLRAPVTEEVTCVDLEVEGEIPTGMNGSYVVNSPNPRFAPKGRYHWFDGDGMVHGVQLEGGRATYRNRYVRTAGLAAEEAEGGALWGGILDPFDPTSDRSPDKNTGNTDLVWHADKLLALWWLGGEPYALDVPSLDTAGSVDFGGKLTCGVAAHPKVDPVTGEMMFFDYSPYEAPYLQYGVVDGAGQLTHQMAIDIPGPRLFHDIAITERYTIFMDLPMLWHGGALESGKRRVDFRPDMPSRFGVIPRHGTPDQVRWFEAPACYVYHTINAHEEGDEIVMTACRIENPLPRVPHDAELHIPRLYFLRLEPYLTRWRFNLETGAVTEDKLDDVPTEFPRMNDAFLGRKSRFAYNPRLAREPTLLFDGVIKYDLETGRSDVHSFGADRFGDEAVFVPRPGATDEDDGWLVSSVHDRVEGKTALEIFDPRDMGAAPLARVSIPKHVPTGFHACWVPGGNES